MNQSKKHKYKRPPPGQGSSRDQICVVCGQRKSVAGDGECRGHNPDVVLPTEQDYDPFN